MKKIMSLLLCMLFAFTSIGCGNSSQGGGISSQKEVQSFNPDSRWNSDGSFKLENSSPGTSAAVDEIMLKGKKDADNYSNIDGIIKLLKGHVNDPWNNNNVMEGFMYWGRVLECSKYSKLDEKKVGIKAYETVKYVYRNAESKEDAQATQGLLIKALNELK